MPVLPHNENFPPKGLVYFWILNDHCDFETLDKQLLKFAEAGTKALVLHPRPGLLLPYGSRDWFDLIERLVDRILELGMQPWLYDEDPYPSGHAGGLVVFERPDFAARHIARYTFDEENSNDRLMVFPAGGKLLWAGAMPPEGVSDLEPVDLTDRIGTIRKHWEVTDWDSRFYYPATPLYSHPRSGAHLVEYALPMEHVPEGWSPVAFVARPTGVESEWGHLVDTLNPEATQRFIELTHVKYLEKLGDKFGREVPAIFTDEPKYFGNKPYTDAMFDDFEKQYGYRLDHRLNDLFEGETEQAALTRLHYRQWCADRFISAWLKPIADWCDEHHIALVGHMSPEDDPVEQANTLTNLMPQLKLLGMPGLDLIIPAVGDRDHTLINIGPITGVSVAQQTGAPGVMSETLGASGESITTQQAAKVLAWQLTLGVSTIIVHMAMASVLGLRRQEAPPDFGPNSPYWDGITDADRGLRPLVETVTGTKQDAPVAIVWPIRSFLADVPSNTWGGDPHIVQRRTELAHLLQCCLETQTGVHFVDEDDLQQAVVSSDYVQVGQARYTHVLLPSMTTLHADSVAKLAEIKNAGLPVLSFNQPPTQMETKNAIRPITSAPWDEVKTADLLGWCRDNLPHTLDLAGDNESLANIRATTWTEGDVITHIVFNMGKDDVETTVEGLALSLEAGEFALLRRENGTLAETYRFNTAGVSPTRPTVRQVPFDKWQVRWSDRPNWQPLDRPRAVYELRPHLRAPKNVVSMGITGIVSTGGEPVADALEYRTSVEIDHPADGAVLKLEPTTIAGSFTLTIGDDSWDLRITDIDVDPVEIDLSDKLQGGRCDLHFKFDKPDQLDGVRYHLYVETPIEAGSENAPAETAEIKAV